MQAVSTAFWLPCLGTLTGVFALWEVDLWTHSVHSPHPGLASHISQASHLSMTACGLCVLGLVDWPLLTFKAQAPAFPVCFQCSMEPGVGDLGAEGLACAILSRGPLPAQELWGPDAGVHGLVRSPSVCARHLPGHKPTRCLKALACRSFRAVGNREVYLVTVQKATRGLGAEG